MEYITNNIKIIKQNIEQAATKAGRSCEDITLLGVTKTIDNDRILHAVENGITQIGENKVQEIRSKYELFKDKADFHMIGHLQRNKVKYIIDKVKLIHSVDSIRLAEKINEEAQKINIIMPILIQINIAQEESKFGISKNQIYSFIDEIEKLNNVVVKGLMTIAPYVENPENNREYFRQMHQLFIDIKGKNVNNINMDILSMGMTNDYTVAIEEGATLVRIGTGIFGKRIYA